MRHAIFHEVATLQSNAGIVALEALTVEILKQLDGAKRRRLFEQLRLNLQSRLIGMSDDVSIHKLQGKLEYIDELQGLFDEISK